MFREKNSQHVKYKSKVKWSGKTYCYGTGGDYIFYDKYCKATITITYPKNYKNMCILAGGYCPAETGFNYYGVDCDTTLKLWKNKVTFAEAKSLYSGKGRGGKRKVAHGIRVK